MKIACGLGDLLALEWAW